MLIIEPADLDNSTGLRKTVSHALDQGMSIYAPCAFIWGSRCRPESCWSFEVKPSIRPPRLMQALAACSESYRYLNTDIKYSYAILKKDRGPGLPIVFPAIPAWHVFHRFTGTSTGESTALHSRCRATLATNRHLCVQGLRRDYRKPVFAVPPHPCYRREQVPDRCCIRVGTPVHRC